MGGGCSSASPAAAAGVEVAVVMRGRACGGVVRRPQRSHSVPHPLVCRWAAVAGGCPQVRCLRVHRLRCLLSSSSRSTSSTHVRFSHAIHPPAPFAPLFRNWPPALLLCIHRVEIARSTLLLQVPSSKSDEPSAGFFESFVSIHYSIADDSTNRAVQRLGERAQPRTHSPLPLRPSVRGGSSGVIHACCTHVAANSPV